MAQRTDAQLNTEADVIGNETTEGANTADRVRDHLQNIIDSKINNDKISTDGTFAAAGDTEIPTTQAVLTGLQARVPKTATTSEPAEIAVEDGSYFLVESAGTYTHTIYVDGSDRRLTLSQIVVTPTEDTAPIKLLPLVADPTDPEDGDIWYNSTEEVFKTRKGGVTETIGAGGGGTWGSITGTLSDQTDLQSALDAKAAHTNSATALTDGAAITLTATKHTLTSTQAAITFTISYAGDDIVIELTLNATSATWTFPAGSLCVSEGVASGDNTLALAGVSGDKYIITTKKIGSVYYVVGKNFGQ